MKCLEFILINYFSALLLFLCFYTDSCASGR